MEISQLIVDSLYTNSDIVKIFKVSNTGGMRRSRRTNSLVLISKLSNAIESNPYEDKWVEGIFHYTGMGLKGNQELKGNQNFTLAESNKNGIDVYLFESSKPNEYNYRGKAQLYGEIYEVSEVGSNGQIRRVYKFPLKLID